MYSALIKPTSFSRYCCLQNQLHQLFNLAAKRRIYCPPTSSSSCHSSKKLDHNDYLQVKLGCSNIMQKREMKLWNEKLLRKMYWRKRSFDALPEKPNARSEFQEWNYSAEIYSFTQRLQEPELDQPTLMQMFTHRSYVCEQQAKQQSLGISDVQISLDDNSQLIQNGTLIIEQFLPKYLRFHLRHAPEECIQALVQYLTSTLVLSDISKWIGCIDLVLCAEFPPYDQTLSDTVLALIGAIAKTGNMKRAQNFLIDFIVTYLNGVDLLEIWRLDQMDINLDAFLKSLTTTASKLEPKVLNQSAIGTIEACYVVGIYQDGKLIGKSPGESLPIAKRMAELDVFRNIFALRIDQVRFNYGPKSYDLDYDRFAAENFSLIPNFQSRRHEAENKN